MTYVHALKREVDRLTADRDAALAALRAIATFRTPCLECGVAHEYRMFTTGRVTSGTWASPDDGHTYCHMPAAAYAQQVAYDREAS